MKTTGKKILALFLVVLMTFSAFPATVSATCALKVVGVDKLTGNQVKDFMAVVKANLGKKGKELGATEHWCADFVWNCAKKAGISSSIIPQGGNNGGVKYLKENLLKCGATVVTSPKEGDLVFYGNSHVGIMADSINSYHGNFNGKGTGSTWWNSSSVVYCKYNSTSNYKTYGATFIRPKWADSKILTITYNINGGTVTSSDYKSVSGVIYRSDGTLLEDKWVYDQPNEKYGLFNASTFGLTKPGYKFVGWKNSAGTVFDQDDTRLLPSSINPNLKSGSCSTVLYAVWSDNSATITFDPMGGEASNYSIIYDIGSYYGSKMPTAYKSGYTFDGWFSSPEGGTRYKTGDRVSSGNKTLYAHWLPNETDNLIVGRVYRIYNYNSGLPMASANVNYGARLIQKQKDDKSNSTLWRIESVDEDGCYILQSIGGGNAIEVNNDHIYESGFELETMPVTYDDTQKFSIIRRGASENGQLFSIHAKLSNRVIDAKDASIDVESVYNQWYFNNADHQLFYFVEETNRTISFYDNHNNNYMLPLNNDNYSSRNLSAVQTSVFGNVLNINQTEPGDPSTDMTFKTSVNGSEKYDFGMSDSDTYELHFKAKSSVNGAKIYFRWGYSAVEYVESAELTSSWQDFTVIMDRDDYYGQNIHPYVDAVCNIQIKDLVLCKEGDFDNSSANLETTDAIQERTYNVDSVRYKLFPLPTNKKQGFVFTGWYTERLGGTMITDSTGAVINEFEFASNMRLYAHWAEEHIHKIVIDKAVSATCINSGLSQGSHCSECGEIIVAQEVINPLGHDYLTSYTTDIPATCTTSGSKSRHCTRCSEITEATIIPATGHKYSSAITEATCTNAGYTTYTCSTCGNSYVSDYADASGHISDGGIVTKKATCTATGKKTYSCIACGEIIRIETIKKAAHKVLILPEEEATCTEEGLSEGSMCSVCKTVIVEQEPIEKISHNYTTKTTKATLTANGKIVKTCLLCGEKSTTIVYCPKTVKLSYTAKTYTGKALNPTVTVRDSNGKTISSKYYTVSYKNNKNVGKATVTITFKGNYTGKITKTFTINPKGTSISKLTAKSKGFTATWKKQATQTTGYEIQYSTSSKFTSKTTKTIKVTSAKTVSKTVSKLKANSKYYVRVRTYKTVSKTNYYSAWSKALSVKTKK